MLPYWQRRRDAKIANTLKATVLKQRKKEENKVFFEKMLLLKPAHCQNCGSLNLGTIVHPWENIAHILPKEHFDSVRTNPVNIWFACKPCHDYYDREPQEKVALMPIIPMLQARVKKLYPKIAYDERKRIPYYLRPEA